MKSGLEDKIIAYFDGELSDADSAELLHSASVSPEIRDRFREHEMLRELAHEATRSATISSEVESSLFSRIETLAENSIRNTTALVFSRRTVALSVIALVLISGSLGYVVSKLFSTSFSPIAPIAQNIAQPNSPSVVKSTELIENPTVGNTTGNISVSSHIGISPQNISIVVKDNADNEGQLGNSILQNDQGIGVHRSVENIIPEIHQVSVREEDIHSEIGKERFSPFDLKEASFETQSRFELSLQTSSGFTYPADATPIKPFADQRISFAYHVTDNNLIGFRLGSGLYQQLGDVSRRIEGGVEVLSRGIETKRSFSEELFISHLVPLFFVAPFTLEFTVGGGLIPNGYMVGAEAGIRIPLSEAFMFNADFALSRVHSNALSSGEIISSEAAGMMPVVLDGVDIHNTLNGRIHYGLLYRF